MASSFLSILASDLFTFEIGPDKKRFVVHKKAIADESPVLSTLMGNGVMRESATGVAQLEDTEPETFALFAEYAYTGMYLPTSGPTANRTTRKTIEEVFGCPKCGHKRICLSADSFECLNCDNLIVCPDPLIGVPVSGILDDDRSVHDIVFKDGGTVTANGGNFLDEPQYPAPGSSHKYLSPPLGHPQPSILVHARLYVFAQKYMIPCLTNICLHKMHRELFANNHFNMTVDSTIQLLLYTYANTPSPAGNSSDTMTKEHEDSNNELAGDGLRRLTMFYAVAHAKELSNDKSFLSMLKEEDEIFSEYFRGIARHTSYAAKRLCAEMSEIEECQNCG